MICELLQIKWNLVLSTRPFALNGQFGELVVIIDCVVVGVDVALVVVFVVAAVVVDVVVVVVAVFVVVSAVVVTVVVVVVIVVVAVVVVVLVVVVAVVVVFAVVGGGVVVLVVVLVVVEWDVGGSLDVVDDVPDVVSGLDVVVPPENHIFKEKLVLCDKTRCLIDRFFPC